MTPTRAVLAALFLLAAHPALAGNEQFEIRDIPVDATAENATVARDRAIAQGYAKAFDELAKRLLVEGSLPPKPSPSQLDALVQDFEVENERVSPTRYIGLLAFRFRPDPTRAFLARSGAKIAPGLFEPGDPSMAGLEPWHGPTMRFGLVVPIASLEDWVAAREQLQKVPGMRKIDLTRLARNEAHVIIEYPGDAERLRMLLGTVGMDLGQPLNVGENLSGGTFQLVRGLPPTPVPRQMPPTDQPNDAIAPNGAIVPNGAQPPAFAPPAPAR